MRTTTSLTVLASLGLGVLAFACSSESSSPPGSFNGSSGNASSSGGSSSGGSSSGATSSSGGSSGTPVGNETWADGKQLTKSVEITAGSTVEITPGAKITCAPGVAITVKGTLSVKPGAAHAKISCASWNGIVVESGGTLDADGLDLENATTTITTRGGNLAAKLTNGIITSPNNTPFSMQPGSKLAITKSTITGGMSSIAGTFTASYMTYDKGTNEGLALADPAGTMTIADSVLKGSGGGDYVVSQQGKLVHVEYTTIAGAHCGFHFDSVDKFEIDHVTDDTNSYGTMLYGSGAGPNTISYSNFTNGTKDLDAQGTNGPIKVDHVHTGGKDSFSGVVPTITNKEANPVPNAKPR